MMPRTLNVLIAGVHAGTLSQDASGALSFQYLREYRGVPLSSSMPISTRTYRNKAVLPYLWGLLPEDPAARKHVASEANISPNSPFALLGIIGLDCPGAVQFCLPGSESMREERLVPISEAEIAHRLAQGRSENAGWIATNEHWSLGGQQSKFALRRQDGQWFACEGAAATTHILKSGVRGLSHQALNEYVCMQLAWACGIAAAGVEYQEFQGENSVEPAIVVKRYDRALSKRRVVRLHQEDFCQALGCLPENKYTEYGGPSAADITRLLMSTGPAAQANTACFLQMLFFNYLIAATDAHAKNYSLLLNTSGAHSLAPLYDVASFAPYVDADQWNMKPPKLAMSVGGENRVGRISMHHLENMVAQCNLERIGITAAGCAALLCHYADIIPEKLANVFDSLEQTESAAASRELRAHMESRIAQLCAKAKNQLQA